MDACRIVIDVCFCNAYVHSQLYVCVRVCVWEFGLIRKVLRGRE